MKTLDKVQFTDKLYSQLSGQNKFFSPLSIVSALGMCAAGAKGETKSNLLNALSLPPDYQTYFQSINQEVETVSKGENKPELSVANALWAQNGLQFNSDYATEIKEVFNGSFKEVNYKSPIDAAKVINKWCDEKTNNKIPEIVTSESIDSSDNGTKLILTNAIYFKGKWEKEFNKKRTKSQPFYGLNKTTETALMYQSDYFGYFENEAIQAIDLPYKGDDLSMLVVLPKQGDEFVNPSIYNDVSQNLIPQEVNVYLPRFKLETQYQLNAALCDLGASLAFSNDADFSGITKDEQLKIDQVIHKAFVECDEEGTEAAAATAVLVMRATCVRRQIIFRCDRPFLFFIHNKETGTIYFCGSILDM